MNNSTKSILTITPSALGIIALSSLSITFSLQILAGLVVLNLITDMIIRLSTNDKDLLENFSSALLITLITSVLVFVPYLFAPIFLQVFPFIKLLMLTNHLLPSLLVSSAFILDIILRSTFSNKIDGSASNGQTYTYNGINPLFKGNPDGKQQLETLNKENADRTGLIVKNLQRIRDMITNNGDENNISTSEVYTEVGLDSIDYQVNAITERLGQYINDITTTLAQKEQYHNAEIQELTGQYEAALARKEQELKTQHEETLGDLKKTHSTELSELKTQHETILAQKEQELTSQHEAALNSAKQSHTTEIEELKTQHTANIQELTSQHEEALNSAKQSHTTEIEELKTQHTANIQELTSQHEEALNSAKQSHTTEIEELKTQHTANIQELKEIHVSKLQQNEVKISDIEAQLGVKDEKIQHLESAALKADNTKLSIISTVKQNNADLSNELSTEKDRNESLRGQIIANLEEYADKTRELKQTIEDLQNQISKLQESNEDQAAELDSYHENIMNIQGLQEEKDNALTSLEKHVAKLNEQLGKIGIDILKEDLDQFKALIDGNVTKIAEFKAAARTLVDNHFINISEIHQANNPGPADSSKDGLESDDEDINLNGEIETSFQSEDSDIREKGGSGNAKALVNHGLLTAKSQEGSHTATSNPQEYQNTFK
jgi:hypothetical protein